MNTTAALPAHPRTKKVQTRRPLARFIRILQKNLPDLAAQDHFKSLGVFGSYVRGEQEPRSDLDVLVEFLPEYTLHDKFALKEFVSNLLGVEVDVVNKEGLPFFIGKRVLRKVIWLQKDGVMQSVKLPPRKPTRVNGKRNGANMEPKREYLDSLQDMLDAMGKVQRIVADLTMEEWVSNLEKDWAVRYGFQIIGEAANRIPREIQEMYPHIPWKDIIGMRNAMAHGYDPIVYTEIWKAIHEAIPRVQPLVAEMLDAEKERRGVDDATEHPEPTG